MSTEQNAILNSALGQIEKLQAALEREDPNIKNYLKMINEDIRQHPELMHLLNDDQIATVYKATMKQTNVIIEVAKSKGNKTGKAAKQMGLLPDGTNPADLL